MDEQGSKRKGKRKEISAEIQVRFFGQDNYTTVVTQDISTTGIRVITTRLLKVGDFLDIHMRINGQDIQCKGKVAWVLLLRPGLGSISSFDMGLEFCDLKAGDKEFLGQLT
jgi:hypothetical protein